MRCALVTGVQTCALPISVWPVSWIGWRAPARPAAGHPHRQRQGVLWQGDARVGTCPWRRLRLIEPGKPTQNAYVESLNGRLRDECLNEHWFKILLHARTVIETWRCAYNEERPTQENGGLTPSAYATTLPSATIHPGLSTTVLLPAGGRQP